MQDIYEAAYVEDLFDRMSGSYDRMNYITSFGFSSIWRKQCVGSINLRNAEVVVDLLSGMGECWKPIIKNTPRLKELIAIDFSKEMIKLSEVRKNKFKSYPIRLLKENVFQNSIPDATADAIISGFGLKTFSAEQIEQLALEIERMLKVNGEFSLIDVSVPRSAILRAPYLFYLKNVIPVLGKLFLGNPDTYKMLGVYTEKFRNSKATAEIFRKHNLEVEYVHYFWGCASGIKGRKLLAKKAEQSQTK